MTILVIVILAGVWIAVLVPPWLQNRSEGRPADSISSFRRQLSVLERSNPAIGRSLYAVSDRPQYVDGYAYAYRAPRADVRRPRRDVLFTLLAAAGLTFGLAVLIGGPVWYLQLIVDVLLASYVALLARTQRLAAERMAKVRYLPQPSAPEPALLYRRSGS